MACSRAPIYLNSQYIPTSTYHYKILNTTTLAGDPSISLRNNGKQTRNILLPKHCFTFTYREINKQIILSAILLGVVTTTVILSSPTLVLAKKSKSGSAELGGDTYQAGYNKGFKDEQGLPFDQNVFSKHSQQYINGYEDGFRAGCLSVSGNTLGVCENAMDKGG